MITQNFLFICSRNQWRSKTAEDLFKNSPRINVRSAGTSASARIKVNANLLDWADLIFVMENHHKKWLTQNYPVSLEDKKIIVLDIPDEYDYMNAELISMLEMAMNSYLD